MRKLTAILFIAIATYCSANEQVIKCTDDVLKQIYPNQNACVLQEGIPSKLQNLPFVTYPVEVSELQY